MDNIQEKIIIRENIIIAIQNWRDDEWELFKLYIKIGDEIRNKVEKTIKKKEK